jgi:hypothetical protein
LDGTKLEVTDPATGELLCQVPDMGAFDAVLAIEAAADALPQWSGLLAKERSNLLHKWFRLTMECVLAGASHLACISFGVVFVLVLLSNMVLTNVLSLTL